MEKRITIQDGFKMLLDESNGLLQRPLINNREEVPFTDLDSLTNSITFKNSTSLKKFSLTENFKQQGISNEQFSVANHFSSNSLIEQSFGWLDNSTNTHNFSSADVRCNCPSCRGNLLPANAGTNNTSYDTSPQEATTAMSGDSQINGILSGYKWGFSWGNRQLTYSFYEDSVFAGSYYGSETGVKEVSEAVKNNVRTILNWLENVIDVDFVEVTETANDYGRLRIMRSDNPNYAYAYYPNSDALGSRSGDVHLKTSYDHLGNTNGFQHPAGKHGYQALIHELGHALGLKHPHDLTSFSRVTLPSAENNQTNTVMTYKFESYEPGTFMRYDIKALQYLYGIKDNNTGDTTYQFTNRIDLFSVNGQESLTTPYLTKQLIWDSAGIDTLDFSELSYNSAGYRFDLSSGGLLSVTNVYNTMKYGTEIAYDVSLENLINSSSNDTVFLNNAANVISGYTTTKATGNDVIYNGSAQDTLKLDYDLATITQTKSGNDLILKLDTNGSITVKNYYLDSTNGINIFCGDILVPSLSIEDITVVENGTATLTVNLSAATTQMVTVNYTTANGTAVALSDYTAQTGTLTFNPGETSQSLTFNLVNDNIYELTEKFNVNLSNAQNAILAKQQAVLNIIDDDPQPTISVTDVTKLEGTSSTVGKTASWAFNVSLSNASSQTTTVQYGTADETAIAGSDYIATQGTLTFKPGQTTKTLYVNVYTDTIQESDETFFFNLSNAQNALIGKSQGLATILNDELTQSNNSANTSVTNDQSLNSLTEDTPNRDFLTGTNKADTLVLGDRDKVYYAETGIQDFAIIQGFSTRQKDVIQLHGSADLYELAPSSISQSKDTAIFYKDGNNQELIALISGVNSLSLESPSFTFV